MLPWGQLNGAAPPPQDGQLEEGVLAPKPPTQVGLRRLL